MERCRTTGLVRMVEVLVTGGAGFIGSNFVRHALDRHADWHVTNDALAGWDERFKKEIQNQ